MRPLCSGNDNHHAEDEEARAPEPVCIGYDLVLIPSFNRQVARNEQRFAKEPQHVHEGQNDPEHMPFDDHPHAPIGRIGDLDPVDCRSRKPEIVRISGHLDVPARSKQRRRRPSR